MMADVRSLELLEKKVLWLASWMIHHANHVRSSDTGGVKVGGHQASSASLATVMTALYLKILRPQDRVAVKPHASPNLHALQYMLRRQSLGALKNFRGYGGAQSYPSRTKDTCDVDFSTGSVGLGVAQTLFASIAQDYVQSRQWDQRDLDGRMIALIGDAEIDEGNIFEALLEGWKHNLKNTWWIIDYNRQSLDAVVREDLWLRFQTMFKNFGWDVVILKYGRLQEAAFKEPGGNEIRTWIDRCPNQLYAALTFEGAAAWRRQLLADLGENSKAVKLIGSRTDRELESLMTNLGGHDMAVILDAFQDAQQHERPVCFLAYTIKGHGLPIAGHKDNHAGMMTPSQIASLQSQMGVANGFEWDIFAGLERESKALQRLLENAPIADRGGRRHTAPSVPVPAAIDIEKAASLSTQQAFGQLMHAIAKRKDAFADRVVTTSPDVTVSTNLGAWVNRRGIFATQHKSDVFRDRRIPSTFSWSSSPKGQHIELGIAEMNLFLLLSSLGLSHSLFGERLFPVGTLYDPFIKRGLDALNYACYQDARFLVVATPSGVTLAPEGGAHQSIATPLIGLAQDGLASFEPSFADELGVIFQFAFDYMQRQGSNALDPRTSLPDEDGGAVYLRLSTRPLDQPATRMNDALRQDILAGGYWLRPPGPNAEIVIAYTGVMAPEAIEAAGLMSEDRRDIGVLAVTSADRLFAGWTNAQRSREDGYHQATCQIERLLENVPKSTALVTVLDGHPATLSWIGSVKGHRTRALGVERFGQTGTIAELYRHYGIDSRGIVSAASALTPGKPIRHS